MCLGVQGPGASPLVGGLSGLDALYAPFQGRSYVTGAVRGPSWLGDERRGSLWRDIDAMCGDRRDGTIQTNSLRSKYCFRRTG